MSKTTSVFINLTLQTKVKLTLLFTIELWWLVFYLRSGVGAVDGIPEHLHLVVVVLPLRHDTHRSLQLRLLGQGVVTLAGQNNNMFHCFINRMDSTLDLPFLNIHNPFTNEIISVYLDKHNRMFLNTKDNFVKQTSHSKGAVIVSSA